MLVLRLLGQWLRLAAAETCITLKRLYRQYEDSHG